jgi:sulfide:quinone oxidoreductase
VIGAANTSWGDRVDVPLLAAPCEGPIAEMMFMIDHELRGRGLRDESTLRVFSPGRIFFEDVGPSVHAAVGPLIEKAGIEVVPSKRISKIHADGVELEDGDRWPSALTVVIPPFAAPAFVARSDGLGDARGFVPTDRQMRHLDFPDIFAAGDGTSLAMPKLGHIAVHQADVATAALKRELTGEGEIPEYAPEVFCIINQGGSEGTLIHSNHLFGGDVDRAFTGPLSLLTRMIHLFSRG